MMKVSMSIGTLVNKYGPEKGFAMMKEAGFDGVDFGFHLPYAWGDVVSGRTDGIFARSDDEIHAYYRPYMDALKANGLEMLQAHTPFPLYTRHENANRDMLQAAKKCIMLCGENGCRYLVVHPRFGDYDWRLSTEEQWRVNREMYTDMIPLAREYGVNICLENMYTVYRGRIIASACSDMHEAVTYIDRLNDIAGEEIFCFCYDTGHQMIVGQDLRENIRTLGKRVKALHMHDNDGRGDQHIPAYMGLGDWNGLLEGLKEVGYTGTLNFETNFASFPEALWPQVMKLITETGRYFASQLEGQP